MADKLNIPEEICLGKPEYSSWTDWRVNGWLLVAALISGAADILFPRTVAQWPGVVRVAIVVAQFLAIALWTRSLARWIAGMDELHRQLMMKVVLFAVGATLFAVMLWHRLQVAGLFSRGEPIGESPGGASWDMLTVAHVFLLLTLTYFAGYFVMRRRYE